MYIQEGSGNGQGEQEVTSPSHYIFEQFQNSYQFRILFTNPEKIFELLCPFVTDGVNEMTHSETYQWVLSIKDPLVKGRFSVFICIAC